MVVVTTHFVSRRDAAFMLSFFLSLSLAIGQATLPHGLDGFVDILQEREQRVVYSSEGEQCSCVMMFMTEFRKATADDVYYDCR